MMSQESVTTSAVHSPDETPVAVVLLQFGGPDSLEAVEPFLFNLFSDPDIIQLPFGTRFQSLFAKRLSRSRAGIVREEYEEMGGKSPIGEKTAEQLDALQRFLDQSLGSNKAKVHVAMRYWNPLTDEAMKSLLAESYRDVVLLPLYAQYSSVNAGSSFNEWNRAKTRLGAKFNEERIIEYRTHPKYIGSINARIDEALTRFEKPEDVYFLFSAHGIPVDLVFGGDPYPHQIRDSVEAVMALRGFDHKYSIAYQSKVGPKAWLTPKTDDVVEALGISGVRNLLVIPIAFVSDHIETVQELDKEEREHAEEVGITNFEVTEGLNSHPLFIEALGELVIEKILALRPSFVVQRSQE